MWNPANKCKIILVQLGMDISINIGLEHGAIGHCDLWLIVGEVSGPMLT